MTGAPPILVLGVARRSGTNHLARLLAAHPDCDLAAVPEDHLLRAADLLARYGRTTARRWPARWGDRDARRRALTRSLGAGLVRFLDGTTANGHRVVTKTPSVDNLDLCGELLPDVPVVVVVRDGRSVVQSLVTGFRFSFERAAREWRGGARTLLAHHREGSPPVAVVRFEDLVADPAAALPDVLRRCGLDPHRYDFGAAAEAPVVGSSFERAGAKSLTWDPIRPPGGFDPADRWRGWPRRRHERFAWLCGRQQRALGYETVPFRGRRLRYLAYNLVLDAVWPLLDGARRLDEGLRRRLRPRRRR